MYLTKKIRNTAVIAALLSAIVCASVFYFKSIGMIGSEKPEVCNRDCVQTISEQKENNQTTVFITEYRGGFDAKTTDLFIGKLNKVREKANSGDILIIRIESSGGSASACRVAYDEVMDLKSLDISITAVSDYGALSCGYMLASAADTIYASSGAEIGNIGIAVTLSNKPVVGSTRLKEIFAGSMPKNKAEVEMVRKHTMPTYNEFVARVKATRPNIDKSALDGSFYSGQRAIEKGLIDGIMNSNQIMRRNKEIGRRIVEVK